MSGADDLWDFGEEEDYGPDPLYHPPAEDDADEDLPQRQPTRDDVRDAVDTRMDAVRSGLLPASQKRARRPSSRASSSGGDYGDPGNSAAGDADDAGAGAVGGAFTDGASDGDDDGGDRGSQASAGSCGSGRRGRPKKYTSAEELKEAKRIYQREKRAKEREAKEAAVLSAAAAIPSGRGRGRGRGRGGTGRGRQVATTSVAGAAEAPAPVGPALAVPPLPPRAPLPSGGVVQPAQHPRVSGIRRPAQPSQQLYPAVSQELQQQSMTNQNIIATAVAAALAATREGTGQPPVAVGGIALGGEAAAPADGISPPADRASPGMAAAANPGPTGTRAGTLPSPVPGSFSALLQSSPDTPAPGVEQRTSITFSKDDEVLPNDKDEWKKRIASVTTRYILHPEVLFMVCSLLAEAYEHNGGKMLG
ncbi:hypothetical protein PLESTB_000255300 [Pleodorina starrii]|uniref:Uncharacterized protein n=1 Tax=Pleodorina starrii TaxID=330485 RepID=A0A9W6EYA9_9CHLO|nr:hypothetical protein PLESTB_000255300 [Pleodorina starrii]